MAIMVRTREPGDRRAPESQLASQADLVIRPPVAGYGPLDFRAARVLAETADRRTRATLEAGPCAGRVW